MTESQILKWIKTNLAPVIDKAIADSGDVPYTQDWLAAMAMREVNFLIFRHADKSLDVVAKLMKGDYGQRPGETVKSYHGFGFWQIDIASYPDFINSGDWQDAYKCCLKAIKVLNEKRAYITSRFAPLEPDALNRATTAAYNTGQGNVVKSLQRGRDVDYTTHQKNYSAEVWRYRSIYNSLT